MPSRSCTVVPQGTAPVTADWLERSLAAAANARVVVVGDYCLDGYWMVDGSVSEPSLETGLPVRRISVQRYSPGGAGNVAANLRALQVPVVRAVGVIGHDMFGRELVARLSACGVATEGLIPGPVDWVTPLYAKPMVDGTESNRMDFGTTNTLPEALVTELLDVLAKSLDGATAVVVNQQLAGSLLAPSLVDGINELILRHPHIPFVVDSREHAPGFRGGILKLNASEAAAFLAPSRTAAASIPLAETAAHARAIATVTARPVFITCGANGILAATPDSLDIIPGIQTGGRTDPVGAGDTVVAALASVLGGKLEPNTAAQFANLCAALTVRKINTTGTVSPDELRALGPSPDYIYEPELAESPRLARFLAGSEIEIIRENPAPHRITHAIFDHDGTLSTLRQGWERIMEPMMMKAILGRQLTTVPAGVHQRIESEVRAFIDRTTGIQTLAQMKGLAELVREHGCIPASEVLDEHGYKAIYNQDLIGLVQSRIRKIDRGELTGADFEIKNARRFLDLLHGAGVKLYLASGTDEADVRNEAAVMGYAHLFEDRIHGAVGDLRIEAKRIVIERIIQGGHLTGANLMIVGDGPVEIREGRKRDAFCVGLASNELCRYGLDPTKRKRLVRAGADIIIPDYAQLSFLRALISLPR